MIPYLRNVLQRMVDVLNKIARERRYLIANPARFRLIDTADDMLASKKHGTLAVSFNLQGTKALAGHLDMVEVFYKLGVRHMLMAYNKITSCFQPEQLPKLTEALIATGYAEDADCGILGDDFVRVAREVWR